MNVLNDIWISLSFILRGVRIKVSWALESLGPHNVYASGFYSWSIFFRQMQLYFSMAYYIYLDSTCFRIV